MKLTFDQTIQLSLAGTVALPSVVPPLAIVTVDTDALERNVLVLLEKHDTCTVTRIVLLKDVAALFIPSDAEAVERCGLDLREGTWLLGPQIVRERIECAPQEKKCKEGLGAVVHLPERARLIETISCGTTAGESAQRIASDYNCCGPACCHCPH